MFSPHISHASTKYVRNVTVDKCFVTELFKWLWLDLRFLLLVKEILGLLNHNSRKIISGYFIYFYFEQKQQYQSGQYKMQTADCRPGTKCRLGTKCKLQTADWVKNVGCEFILFFRLILDNMSSYNLPSVTQSRFPAIIFHDYLHYCQAACTIVEYSLPVFRSQSFLI